MEFGSGITRFETARQLGITFQVSNTMPSGDLFTLEDGIEAVRATIPRIWIDEKKCERFIKCIENYRREWDSRREMYKDKPVHDWASHFADSLRYLCLALPKMRDGITEQDVERQRHEALYGQDFNLPPVFRQDNNRYF